jgi:mannose-6-phosphate isomerase-like protein (cupin superfamily)
MAKRAFVIAGDRAATIANDDNDFRYRATVHTLPIGAQATAKANPEVETQFMVEDGIVEFMVNGATWHALAGDFVRVRPGRTYAYRNAGDGTATILERTVSPEAYRRALRIVVCAA